MNQRRKIIHQKMRRHWINNSVFDRLLTYVSLNLESAQNLLTMKAQGMKQINFNFFVAQIAWLRNEDGVILDNRGNRPCRVRDSFFHVENHIFSIAVTCGRKNKKIRIKMFICAFPNEHKTISYHCCLCSSRH